MTASIWNPEKSISANSSIRSQAFVATAGQTNFTLTDFAYAVGTNSLEVYFDGLYQRLTQDWSEVATNEFKSLTPLPKGTIVVAVGQIGITGTSVFDPNAARKGVNSDITELTGLTTPLSRGQGGTGVVATTVADLRNQLAAAVSGANNDITSMSALASGTPFRKNAIINGDFQIWQEGTSFAAMANGTYIADMWRYNKVGAMVHTGSRSTDVPTIVQAGRKINYSLLIDCTTADTAIAAGDYAILSNYVEGYNFVNIAGVGLCHQFWHKHTKVGTYCIAYANSNNDRSFVREYVQDVSDTWELATVLVDASPTAGTWDYTNAVGYQVIFALACGTTFQAAAGAWQIGTFFSTANQVNACDSVANNFMLAGVQLEKGSVATEFDVLTFQDELEDCKRFYRKSFSYATAPATNAGDVDAAWSFSQIVGAGVGQFGNRIPLGGSMRTTPTVILYNPSAANSSIRNIQRGNDATNGTISPAHNGIDFAFTASAGSAAGDRNAVHWTASARF